MKLFNLTYKDKQFISCLSPTYLPDKINKIKGFLKMKRRMYFYKLN